MTEMLFPGLSKYISEDVASAGKIWIVSSVSSMSTRKHFDKELDGIFQFLEVDVEEFPPESMQRSQAPAEEY
ncbi:unnamed protein product [Caretta caretta]